MTIREILSNPYTDREDLEDQSALRDAISKKASSNVLISDYRKEINNLVLKGNLDLLPNVRKLKDLSNKLLQQTVCKHTAFYGIKRLVNKFNNIPTYRDSIKLLITKILEERNLRKPLASKFVIEDDVASIEYGQYKYTITLEDREEGDDFILVCERLSFICPKTSIRLEAGVRVLRLIVDEMDNISIPDNAYFLKVLESLK